MTYKMTYHQLDFQTTFSPDGISWGRLHTINLHEFQTCRFHLASLTVRLMIPPSTCIPILKRLHPSHPGLKPRPLRVLPRPEVWVVAGTAGTSRGILKQDGGESPREEDVGREKSEEV
jgi:hypothetical protein